MFAAENFWGSVIRHQRKDRPDHYRAVFSAMSSPSVKRIPIVSIVSGARPNRKTWGFALWSRGRAGGHWEPTARFWDSSGSKKSVSLPVMLRGIINGQEMMRLKLGAKASDRHPLRLAEECDAHDTNSAYQRHKRCRLDRFSVGMAGAGDQNRFRERSWPEKSSRLSVADFLSKNVLKFASSGADQIPKAT